MPITLVCETCGQPFKVDPHRKGEARFCSQACYHEWRGNRYFGPTILDRDSIVERYAAGEFGSDIAKDLGVSHAAISYHLRQAGIEERTHKITDEERKRTAQLGHEYAKSGPDNSKWIDLPIDEIMGLYKEGLSATSIGAKYGVNGATIARRLIDAGIKMRPAGFARRRRCPDGHIVDSQWEYGVDRWLEEHGLEHEVHPYAPWYNGGKSPQRGDFKVGNAYIEVWGVIGNEQYAKRRKSKQHGYEQCGVRLIEIYPHHILADDYSPLEVLLE